jgi:hypothetical protein
MFSIGRSTTSPFGGLPFYLCSKQERMQLPKKLIHPKLTEQELIDILLKIEDMKAKAIKNQQYERAAELRDDERKYRGQLEDLMNPPTKSNHGNSENQD